ncbi:MAG: hypothetical protein KJ077_24460 [Anaerolineae bacterium]|nr:hypothetical protein [Anaerolineae bacterium]
MNFVKTQFSNLTGNSRLTFHISAPKVLRGRFTLYVLRFTLYALLLCLASPAAAQTPADANAELFLKAPQGQPLTVGDRVTLRLEVTHPADSQVTLPEVPEQWGPFEVVEQSPPETVENDNGTTTSGKDIVVTLFEPGEYQTPPLVVTHSMADGSQEELGTPVVQLTITSILTDDTELRDLKPQAELPLPPIWPWVVATILLSIFVLGLLAGVALWLYDRRRRRAGLELAPVPFVDPRPPEVIALTELDRIEGLNLPARNEIKEHYSLVDVCLRRYIEGRYQIPALEQTSAELRTAFRKSGTLAEDAAEFMDIFSESDLVKFARYVPHADNVNNLVNRARHIVHVTTPEVVAAPEEPAALEAEVMP